MIRYYQVETRLSAAFIQSETFSNRQPKARMNGGAFVKNTFKLNIIKGLQFDTFLAVFIFVSVSRSNSTWLKNS